MLSGLQRLGLMGAADQDWVLVHDAARPNLAREDLDKLLHELAADPVGGLLAVPARDTLKRADADGRVAETVDRSVIWQAFTPQMFRLGMLRDALGAALGDGVPVTDEASAIEWAGIRRSWWRGERITSRNPPRRSALARAVLEYRSSVMAGSLPANLVRNDRSPRHPCRLACARSAPRPHRHLARASRSSVRRAGPAC